MVGIVTFILYTRMNVRCCDLHLTAVEWWQPDNPGICEHLAALQRNYRAGEMQIRSQRWNLDIPNEIITCRWSCVTFLVILAKVLASRMHDDYAYRVLCKSWPTFKMRASVFCVVQLTLRLWEALQAVVLSPSTSLWCGNIFLYIWSLSRNFYDPVSFVLLTKLYIVLNFIGAGLYTAISQNYW
jgi:hypothetical protein